MLNRLRSLRPAHRARPLRLAALLLLIAGCQDGSTGPEKGGATAKAGVLTLSVAIPNADDRAIVVVVSGPEAISSVASASPSYVVHSRISGTSARTAVFGALAAGPLLRLTVPDVNKVSSYSATVVEVATATNGLREATAGYTLTLAK